MPRYKVAEIDVDTLRAMMDRSTRKGDMPGVGKDEPVIAGEHGGKQARALYAFHLCDYDALLAIARVLQEGAERYERDNWRKIPAEEHFNHMIIHALAWLKGDEQDDHLGHMVTRAMMMYATGRAASGDL